MAKTTVPLGRAFPTKSSADTEFVPVAVIDQFTVVAIVVSPVRVTVIETGAEPEFPSVVDIAVVGNATLKSSLIIKPLAAVVVIAVPDDGLESVTINPSSGSIVVSPLTSIVTTCEVSLAANDTVPVIVAQSVAGVAGFVPDPVTVHVAELVPVVTPDRVNVKVNGVVAVLPSFLLASVAAMAICVAASSFRIVPVADAGDPTVAEIVPEPIGFNSETRKVSSA